MSTARAARFDFIPAIDLIGGKCVRLTQGDYAQKTVYHDDPVTVAKQFESAGVKRLHLVDLDGAKAGKVINQSVLEKIAAATELEIDFGGASLVTVGSIAAKDPELVKSWLNIYGAARFFLGADARDEKIAVHGWLEQTDIFVFDFVRDYAAAGLKNVFCTDISKDGMMQGPSGELYKMLLKRCPGILLTASGGIRNMQDVAGLIQIGCSGAIVGKAIYEGQITLKEIELFHAGKTTH
ncbi:MAG: phosphoribosylformimino-5-aminoimidazole carboxamide ribotide isomerase [Bacteroidetes bacterium]|nr:MAG: phosphoribosylformimino-5-aminoimidazole carboxamide ribotide isomerase [Bacteroidota bacterium]